MSIEELGPFAEDSILDLSLPSKQQKMKCIVGQFCRDRETKIYKEFLRDYVVNQKSSIEPIRSFLKRCIRFDARSFSFVPSVVQVDLKQSIDSKDAVRKRPRDVKQKCKSPMSVPVTDCTTDIERVSWVTPEEVIVDDTDETTILLFGEDTGLTTCIARNRTYQMELRFRFMLEQKKFVNEMDRLLNSSSSVSRKKQRARSKQIHRKNKWFYNPHDPCNPIQVPSPSVHLSGKDETSVQVNAHSEHKQELERTGEDKQTTDDEVDCESDGDVCLSSDDEDAVVYHLATIAWKVDDIHCRICEGVGYNCHCYEESEGVLQFCSSEVDFQIELGFLKPRDSLETSYPSIDVDGKRCRSLLDTNRRWMLREIHLSYKNLWSTQKEK